LPIRLLVVIRRSWQLCCGVGVGTEIRRVKIIFSGNANQREKRIPAGIGEGGSHSLRGGDIGLGSLRFD